MVKKVNSQIQVDFGKNLRRIREEKGLSLAQMAVNCDVDKSNIAKIENGKFNIQLSKIFELAKGLNIDAKELLDFKL
ncbi:helix-turn-helix transcriptional regulator [Mucilaginibacter sp. Bleaf8]|uniref:helix-turn-helix domain-containing protein n=1 Tax=Mucilaginibacter sp. Bleaf8 TaxID=2834430 RepID=UPI001BCCD99C|nr:helix-turn-helix transcriptional regulator [Mucilaginibacter sp. Bleaf8]MBS7565537.1 helix-turn-helix transcriptional regulator [Mucilaginibacter sp. Bleaf8]